MLTDRSACVKWTYNIFKFKSEIYKLSKSLTRESATYVCPHSNIPSPISNQTSNNLSELESTYVDLWDEFFVDDLIIEINPLIRPAVSSSLDSVQQLLDEDEISFDIAKSIDRVIFAAVFFFINNKKKKKNYTCGWISHKYFRL